MDKRIWAAFTIAVAIILGAGPTSGRAAGQDVAPAKWEYKALTRESIAELGQKNFEVGLNRLGEQGWELVAVDPAVTPQAQGAPFKSAEYVFKRLKVDVAARVTDVQGRIKVAQADLEQQRQRVSWVERMAARDYVSGEQIKAEQTRLKAMELALDKVRKELDAITPGGDR